VQRRFLFLAYVAALAVFAGAAWQFRLRPEPPDPSAIPAVELRRMAARGFDIPEHLYPEDAYVDELTPVGRKLGRFRPDFSTFKSILDDGTVRLYQIMPGPFDLLGPTMIGLKSTNGKFAVFVAKGANNADARIVCEKPLDAALGSRVVAAWEKVLLETRPTIKIPFMGADGAVEHFGLATRVGAITGKMWNPAKPYKPFWLSQAAIGLATVCEKGAEAVKGMRNLETALSAIETAK
jgi:hypothetical protein